MPQRPLLLLRKSIKDHAMKLHPMTYSVRHHLAVVCLATLSMSSAYAIQPLSDAELDRRYLVSDNRPSFPQPQAIETSKILEQVRLVLASAANPPDLSTTQNVLDWQIRQPVLDSSSSVSDQNFFALLAVNELGSEPYSFRWWGNEEQIIQIESVIIDEASISTFIGDVEVRNANVGQVSISVRTF